MRDLKRKGALFSRTSDEFADLCYARAGVASRDGYRVDENGMVIEQAQILATHNLAVLAGPLSVVPEDGWAIVARRSYAETIQLVDRLAYDRQPLRTVKNAAYAWRQTLFYLALTEHQEHIQFAEWAQENLRAQRADTASRLLPLLSGFYHVLAGGRFDEQGMSGPAGRRFLGWSNSPQWMIE